MYVVIPRHFTAVVAFALLCNFSRNLSTYYMEVLLPAKPILIMTAKSEKILVLSVIIPLALFLAYLFARETLAEYYGKEVAAIVVDSHRGSKGNANISVWYKYDNYSLTLPAAEYNNNKYGNGDEVIVKYYEPLDFMVWPNQPGTGYNIVLLILLSIALIYLYRRSGKKDGK